MEQVLYQLPDGWKWNELNKVVDLVTKGTTPTSVGFKFEPSGINFVKIENIKNGEIDPTSFNSFISSEANTALKRSRLCEGDILFSIAGTIGTVALVNSEVLPANTNQALAIIRGYEDHLLGRYLMHILRSSISRTLNNKKRGGALQNISLKDIKETAVPIPPLSEQKRIVEKLDALLTRIDTVIEHLQESVTLKSNLLQSALDGQFAAIADRMTIETLAEVKGGKRLPKGEKLSDEVTSHPYIRVADFTDKGTIDLSDIKYISKEIHEQIKRYVISKDDLYISIAGTIGKTGFVPPELDGVNLTENAAKLVIKDKQKLDLSYLYLFTLTSDFSAQAGLATKTVAQPKLALTRLSKIEIPTCSLENQKDLVATIETLKSKIYDAEEVLLGKIEDLKSLKASILDSAFKGEL